MEYLQMFLMGILSLCAIGVFALMVFVFLYIAIDLIRNNKKRKAVRSNCQWNKSGDLDDYSTQCGNQFYDATESGNPPTDWMTYCPYCSGEVKIE